jgi:hypothetical protein
MHIFLSRSGNNAARDVFCLRARERVASAARGSSYVLPYLGPEILAVLQAVFSFSPNDSPTGPRPPFRKSDSRIITSMVLSSGLNCSPLRTLGVLNVWLIGTPDASVR